MKPQWRGLAQTLILILVIFLLIRLFPLVIRFFDAAAMGIHQFWWAILVMALVGWAIWFFRSRRTK